MIDFTVEKKTEADGLERLEIAPLKRAATLDYSQRFEKSFNSGLKLSLTVSLSRFGGHVYISNADDSKVNIISSQIQLDTCYCSFGGYRHWFLCPGKGDGFCNERVAILYLKDGEFSCRHCHGLTYKSRNVSSRFNRAASKTNALHLKAQALKTEIKRWSYAKRPTKQALKYQRMVHEQREAFSVLEVITEAMHQKSLKVKRRYHRVAPVVKKPKKIEGVGGPKEVCLSFDGQRIF